MRYAIAMVSWGIMAVAWKKVQVEAEATEVIVGYDTASDFEDED